MRPYRVLSFDGSSIRGLVPLILLDRLESEVTICKYLDCGIMENGFARIRCPDCGQDFLVAFSCKIRFFCPSCSEKRPLI